MRIHFLQNVSHSAAHYRRNEKGMIRGGNSDKEDTSGTKERRRKREPWRGRREKAAWRMTKGQGEGRTKGGGKGKPEHFVKQGKMRLRRGTTATFLSLQNYVFRGPPPYLSKHNKFPLCLSRSSSTSSSAFSPPPQLRLFHAVSSFAVLPGSATGTRLSFFYAGTIYLPLITRSLSTSLYVVISVRLRPRPREQHPHPRWIHVFPRIHLCPSFPSDQLIQIGANYRNRVFATLPSAYRGIILR